MKIENRQQSTPILKGRSMKPSARNSSAAVLALALLAACAKAPPLEPEVGAPPEKAPDDGPLKNVYCPRFHAHVHCTDRPAAAASRGGNKW